jgi:G3E family GTPase
MAAAEIAAAPAAAAAGVAEIEHEDDAMPVTVLSGFLGAGKTSMLKHILKGDHGMKIAVIVNDMSELNVDAGIASKAIASDDQLVAMQVGI